MTKEFKIQIPTNIVRCNTINAKQFVMLGKLIQGYYLSNKKLQYKLNHKVLMSQMGISDNKTFKNIWNGLCESGFIYNRMDMLPRKGLVDVILSERVISKQGELFTQLCQNVLNQLVIERVGCIGVRLLYYYKSYINSKDYSKQFAFPGIDTVSNDLGLSRQSVIEYNEKLEECKFVKIERHILSHENEYVSAGDREMLYFTRYNNHYFVRQDQIGKYVREHWKNLVGNA